MSRAERIAQAFHNMYEALAPIYGWETQEQSRKGWDELPEENRRLMVATVEQLLLNNLIYPGFNLTKADA